MIAAPEQQERTPRYAREGASAPEMVATEWVLADGLGGYAMGTALGMPTRRYHGLLVAAASPPVQREVMLHSLADAVVLDADTTKERRVELMPFCFRGNVWAPGVPPLVRFEKGLSCRWTFRVGETEIVKEVRRVRERGATEVSYSVTGGGAVRVEVRPLVAMRDAHGLLSAGDPEGPRVGAVGARGVTVLRGARRLQLVAEGAGFRADPQWWYGFEYAREMDRGFDCLEDLFSPGVFTHVAREAEARLTISAWAGGRPAPGAETEEQRGERIARAAAVVITRLADIAGDAEREGTRKLVAAADDFVVKRSGEEEAKGGAAGSPAKGCTIIAGYPWFADWGRDSMIALPGLLLATGRHGEALTVLETFARHQRNGLIPNHFDDRTGAAEYNTADASLWYLHAACEYRRVSAECSELFRTRLLSTCLEIVEAYEKGTDFGIRVDADGLVTAGDATTQLTWMDAKRDGVVFTPRHGKAVEINALWHHGLVSLEHALVSDPGARGADAALAAHLKEMSSRCMESFRRLFWHEGGQCVHDVLHPGPEGSWVPNLQVRPNQIFAVSLDYSPLEERQQRAVVQCVRSRLLTRHGLRTLDTVDPGYIGRFDGPIARRDAAYHNGTVWPWLMGPYAEALLRLGRFSQAARADARDVLRPLVAWLDVGVGGALGQLPEVFDGDDGEDGVQRPGGCVAQAWSVAEVLRVWGMALGM